MKKYIEKNAILKLMNDLRNYKSLDFVDAIEIVEKQPAADVVEVVRCGECMFWDAPPSCEGLAKCQTGESGVRFRKAYDFCSRGRKKMDGGVNDGKGD